MYKDRDLKTYFSDFFSRKDYIKQRKQKIKRSFVKIKLRLTSVFLMVNLLQKCLMIKSQAMVVSGRDVYFQFYQVPTKQKTKQF